MSPQWRPGSGAARPERSARPACSRRPMSRSRAAGSGHMPTVLTAGAASNGPSVRCRRSTGAWMTLTRPALMAACCAGELAVSSPANGRHRPPTLRVRGWPGAHRAAARRASGRGRSARRRAGPPPSGCAERSRSAGPSASRRRVRPVRSGYDPAAQDVRAPHAAQPPPGCLRLQRDLPDLLVGHDPAVEAHVSRIPTVSSRTPG